MEKNISNFIHIAVFSFPFGTHAAPLLNLVKRVAASVPETVKFSFIGTTESNRLIFSGAKGDEFPNIKAFHNGIPDAHVFSGPSHFEEMTRLMNAAPLNFEKAVKVAEEDTGLKISCLLTDALLWFSADLADKIGVPWVTVWIPAAAGLSQLIYTDDIARLAATNVGHIPGLEGISISDIPKEILLDKEQSPLAFLLHNVTNKLHKATAVVINSFEEIDSASTVYLKSKFQKVLSVGLLTPLVVDSNDECFRWLEKQEDASVVYIGFGTVNTPPPNEIAALAQALEASKTPFLWSLKEHDRKNLPDGFINRCSEYGKFVSWASQIQVLASGKVGVFVTHCGWNSTLESITYGVPMICRPFVGDQTLNSWMVEKKWRIGLKVKDGVFTKSGTINAIQLILSSEMGKEIKKNVQFLQSKAIDAVKPNGTSTRNFQELLELITESQVE